VVGNWLLIWLYFSLRFYQVVKGVEGKESMTAVTLQCLYVLISFIGLHT